jgi:hypothetical protein
LIALAATIALVAAPHPSLFFSASDVPALRAAAATTHRDLATHITTVLSRHLNDPPPTPNDYGSGGQTLFGYDIAAWAFSYQLTGDTRYAAQAWVRLSAILSWPDWGFGFEGGQPDLFTAHLLTGVTCAYDWLYDYLATSNLTWTDAAGNVMPAVDAVRTRLAAEGARVSTYFPNAWWLGEYVQNHNWIDSAALGLVGLALQGEDPGAPNWVAQAQSDLANMHVALGPISDGAWHEGLPYQQYGMSLSLPFWMASRRAGLDYTDMGILRGVGRMYLATTIPDAPRTQILTVGDFTGWPREGALQILRYAASRFRDGVAQAAADRWLGTASRSGAVYDLYFSTFEFIGYDPTVQAIDPHTQPLDTQLSDLQASVMHSTWDAGDLVVAFKAGPYGGRANFDRIKAGRLPAEVFAWGHDHNDDMSFWLYGGGAWLAPETAGYDAGRRPTPVPPGSLFANETQYHNGLLIDGTGELGDVRASDSDWNNPWFFDRDASLIAPGSAADYAVTGGRGANLYDSSLGLTRWDRIVVLARHRYALVHDDIAATAAHDYDWLCHFSDGAVADGTGWIQGTAKNAMSLGVRMVSPASWTIATGFQSVSNTGLFESDGSIAFAMVRPSVPSATQQFLAALVPVKTADWASRLRVDPLVDQDRGAGAVVAPGTALEERWIFSGPAADGKSAGDLALASSLVGMAGYNAGLPTRAFLAGAGKISDQLGSRELLSSVSARAIEADLQGTTLVVTGDGIADFRAYAPGAKTVTVNGTTVDWSSDGSVVVFTGAAAVGGTDAGTPDAGTGTANPGTATGGADGGTPGAPPVTTSSLGPSATHGMGCSQAGPAMPGVLLLLLLAGFARRRRAQRPEA